MSEKIETGVSHIAYFRTDGGSPKLYTQEYVNDLQNKLQQKENTIKEARELLKATEIENSWFKQFKKKQLEILEKENK